MFKYVFIYVIYIHIYIYLEKWCLNLRDSENKNDIANVDVTFARKWLNIRKQMDKTKREIPLLPVTRWSSMFTSFKVCAAIIGKRFCPDRCNFLCVDAMEFLETGVGTPLVLWIVWFHQFHHPMFLFKFKESESGEFLFYFFISFDWWIRTTSNWQVDVDWWILIWIGIGGLIWTWVI